MNIGQVARDSGVSAKMIRYYESIGLISPPERTESNYRVYGTKDVQTLRFIKRARSLGFSMEETAALLALWQDRTRASADVKRIARDHVNDLEMRIADLQSMVDTLRHLIDCCSGDHRPDCPILNDIAGPTPYRKKDDQ